MTDAEKNAMIERMAPLVIKYAKKYGYHVASPIIAQAIHETGYWNDGLSPYNNFFGLKCGGAWKGKSVSKKTWEVYGGNTVNIVDNFRVYDSFEEGIEGYFKFLDWSNYRNLKTAYDPLTYLTLIVKDHYATDPKYVDKCMNYVNIHDLTRFDWKDPKVKPKPILRYGSKGEDVKTLQTLLNQHGFTCGAVDGVFGTKTYTALIAFQGYKNIVKDGVCGPITWEKLESK